MDADCSCILDQWTRICGYWQTTIAFTVARELHLQKKLGASFFCARILLNAGQSKLIFPTIAYSLGSSMLLSSKR